MAISEHASGTRTAGTPPEASFTVIGTTGDTTDGIYQLFIDCANLARGDTFEVQCLERAISSGTSRVVWEAVLANAQDEPIFASPTLILLHSWQFQVRQTAGTARTFDWSIRKVA